MKALYLATFEITKKWTVPIRNWGKIYGELEIMYPDRMARRCSEAGLSCKCIHGMRKTVSSHLRTKLPRATVAELMGHLPETNENFYNFDITELEYKKNMVSALWNESFKPRESCVLEKV